MSNIKNPRNNPLKNPAPVRPPGGSTAPKTVYVCSPFRPTAVSEADREAEQRSNIERALKACRILAMMGIQPLAPHLYFTRFLKDELAAERAAGMQFGLSWLEQADVSRPRPAPTPATMSTTSGTRRSMSRRQRHPVW